MCRQLYSESNRLSEISPSNLETALLIGYGDEDFSLKDCQIKIAIVLSLLSPVFGYIYTRRIKAWLWFCSATFSGAVVFLALFATIGLDNKITRCTLALGIIAAAATDNSRAISNARR